MRHIIAMTAVALTMSAATPSVAFDRNDLEQLLSPPACAPNCHLTYADLTGACLVGAVLCNTTMKDGSINDRDCP